MSKEPVGKRRDAIHRIATESLDLLVVGGGIVGSGIARDATMRGLRVGLVDKHDFAFGTSSRSSRLLHGGLRYLAQGRVRLVREASLEKKILHRIAPHLAVPLAFVFPAYQGTSWPLWQLSLGVKCYDLLCGGRNLGRSTTLSRAATLREIPALTPVRLTGSVRYFDGFTNDSRLVLDTLRSASRHGAELINHLEFRDANRSGERWTCDLKDRLSSDSVSVRARCIVNATGPWAGGIPHGAVQLRLTKGIHIVLDRGRVPVREAVAIADGGRLIFVIPWGKRVILGTTDTDYHGSLEDVRADAHDTAYLLRTANQLFPELVLGESDILSTWAGLRPLIANPDGSPSALSRAHQIRCPEPGWWDVAGGKLTTYRLMAEQTVNQVVRHLGQRAGPCRTAIEPLIPAGEALAFTGLTPPECTRAAVEHFITREWAFHLEDVMLRRTGWHHYHTEANRRVDQVADWMTEALGWTGDQRDEEIAAYRRATDCQPAAPPAESPATSHARPTARVV